MTNTTTTSPLALVPSIETAWQDVDSSFERFCLTAGIGAIEQMLCADAQQLAGAPHTVVHVLSTVADQVGAPVDIDDYQAVNDEGRRTAAKVAKLPELVGRKEDSP